MKILLATHNNNKKKEILDILHDNNVKNIELVTLEDLGDMDDIEENGKTFKDNAFLKASYGYKKFGLPCIADDSGLEVEALNGAPGIYSSRYSGLGSEGNIDLLLKNMEGVNNRKCDFICVICYIDDSGIDHYFEGYVYGNVGKKRVGNNGFGYDPIFMIDENRSMASIKEEEKNRISHRYNAIIKFANYLNEVKKNENN